MRSEVSSKRNARSNDMAFVNEFVNAADKARIDWTQFKPEHFSKPHRPWKWTIDRERDAFLLLLEQTGRDETNTRPDVFILAWKDESIRIEARVTGSGTGKFWDTLCWTVSKVDIPPGLQDSEAAVLQLVREALTAHGRLFDTTHLRTITVKFIGRNVP
jgi:hypothetical protein